MRRLCGTQGGGQSVAVESEADGRYLMRSINYRYIETDDKEEKEEEEDRKFRET